MKPFSKKIKKNNSKHYITTPQHGNVELVETSNFWYPAPAGFHKGILHEKNSDSAEWVCNRDYIASSFKKSEQCDNVIKTNDTVTPIDDIKKKFSDVNVIRSSFRNVESNHSNHTPQSLHCDNVIKLTRVAPISHIDLKFTVLKNGIDITGDKGI